jgi:hypothetical protein
MLLILNLAVLVVCFIALIYGYVQNNRNIMLGAAIALLLSAGFGESVRQIREGFQAGYSAGREAAKGAASTASSTPGK